MIPSNPTRKQQRTYDVALYNTRHLIENFFARLKPYRAIATRYDKPPPASSAASISPQAALGSMGDAT